MWHRRDWLYLAYSAAVILRFVWTPDAGGRVDLFRGLLLPITALVVARMAQREWLHRWGVWALVATALVRIAAGGSRSANAVTDPLFWGVVAVIMLVLAGATNRWPIAAATASGAGGAGAMIGTVLLASSDAPRLAFAALASQIGVLAAICLLALWCQAIVGRGLRDGAADRIVAAVRGALVAALVMALAGALPATAMGTRGIVTLGVLIGLMEAKARPRPRAVDWTPVWRHVNPAAWRPIAVLLFVELLFALLLLRAPGTGDVSSFFIGWISTFVTEGLVEGYRLIDSNYPPLAAVILWIAGELGARLSVSAFVSLKLALAAALLIGTFCVWRWTSSIVLTSLAAGSFLLNGVALGYLDTLIAPTFILSLWALQRRNVALFSALFAVTILIKWQPLVILPFLLLHAVSLPSDSSRGWMPMVRCWTAVAAPALVVILIMVAVFGLEPIRASFNQGSNRNYLSGTAQNLNWILTYYLNVADPVRYGPLTNGLPRIVEVDQIDPAVTWVGLIMPAFLLLYLAALYRLIRSRSSFTSAVECSLAGYLSYFTLSVGVHENHLFPGTLLAVAAAALAPDKTMRAMLIVTMSTLNLIRFYGLTGAPLGFPAVVGVDISVILAAVNVLLFLVFWAEIVSPGQLFSSRESAPRSAAGPGSSPPPVRV